MVLVVEGVCTWNLTAGKIVDSWALSKGLG